MDAMELFPAKPISDGTYLTVYSVFVHLKTTPIPKINQIIQVPPNEIILRLAAAQVFDRKHRF